MRRHKLSYCAKVFTAICLLGISQSTFAEAPPLQSRLIERVDAGTFQFPIDQTPKWLYTKHWISESVPMMFIAETPEKYYPPATFNAQHFADKQVPKGATDAKHFFRGLTEAVAKNYGYIGGEIDRDLYKAETRGDLSGYMVSVPGNIDGVKQDLIIFAATAKNDTPFILTAFTDPGKAAHLQTTFDRIAINIEFKSKGMETFKE